MQGMVDAHALTSFAALLTPCATVAKNCSAIKDYLRNILQPMA
jgi:hypothetical protein